MPKHTIHGSARRGSNDRWSTQKESSARLGAGNSILAARERKFWVIRNWKSPGLCSTNKEATVKKFVLLHYGFEKPTPEIMAAWGKWFESLKDRITDMGGHFSSGREISKAGTKDLPMGLDSITGFTIVSAESIDDAERIAQSNPYISSIRVYEVMSK
jgi:hypothetical protein